MSEPGRTQSETTRAVRAMFRRILAQLGALIGGLTVGGAVVGWLVAGTGGVWGALLAGGVVALFMLGTVLVMLLTADRPLYVASAAGVGGWIGKTVILFVVLVLVRDRDFYAPGVFFVVLVLGVLGSVGIELTAYLRNRVPIIDASERSHGDGSGPPGGGEGAGPGPGGPP